MKIAVSLMVLSLFVNSCMFSNCEKKTLKKSDSSWFKVYKNGKSYIFSSNLGTFDTLTVVTNVNELTNCNKIEIGNYQLNYALVKMTSPSYEDIIYMKFITTESNNVNRSFMFADLYAIYEGNDIRKCKDKIKIESIADSLDVYTFDKSNASSEGSGLIKSFSWSKEHGIVRYITKEDEIFELVK